MCLSVAKSRVGRSMKQHEVIRKLMLPLGLKHDKNTKYNHISDVRCPKSSIFFGCPKNFISKIHLGVSSFRLGVGHRQTSRARGLVESMLI